MKYYDREGNTIDMKTFGRLHNIFEYKVVCQTSLRNVEVSTVWIGLDHSFFEGPILIFETMVFDKDYESMQEQECERYSTYEEAKGGHIEMISRYFDLEREDLVLSERFWTITAAIGALLCICSLVFNLFS